MASSIDIFPGSRYTAFDGNAYYEKICVFDTADGISNGVLQGVEWESVVCDRMAQFYIPGSDVIDIGANIGLNSIGMHRRVGGMFGNGTIHLFEPQHDVFSALRYNTRNMPVSLYNMGIADDMRILRYEQLFGNIGGTPMQGQGGAVGSPFAIQVSPRSNSILAIPLDAIEFRNKVSVLKIDVEGCEHSVLIGARKTIAHHQPTIIIEAWEQNRTVVFDELTKMGYIMKENVIDTFGDDFIWVPASKT